MKIVLKNASPLSGGKLQAASDIVIADGKIENLVPAGCYDGDAEAIDCSGLIAAAGFIDAHTHGGNGHDVMESTPEALAAAGEFHLKNGTTSYCPTTMTAPESDIISALQNIREYKGGGARIFGCHLEGPFLSEKAAGAHPARYLRDPDAENTGFILKNKDVVKRVTVAPNLSGAPFLTELCVKNGIQVSVGHDNSIDDEIYACLLKGATSVTHMYNCTSRPSRRDTPKKHLGLTEIGLIDSRLTDEVIADDRHVPNKLFEMIYRLKGADGIMFVSDSLSVAGMEAGDYYLGGGESKQVIRVEDGVATLPAENTYAGSVTPLSKMAKNIFDNTRIPLEACLVMGTLTPARVCGLDDRGDLQKGMLADINLFDKKLNLVFTIFDGKRI